MKVHNWITLSLVLCALLHTHVAHGTSIDVPGRTASISNGFTEDIHPSGSHFHTANPGDELPSGNPGLVNVDNVAEVGGFFGDEDVRGTSELDLRGLPNGTQAIVLFDVFDVSSVGLSPDPIGGLFGQEPLDGFVDLFAYQGNNLGSTSDYSSETLTESPLTSYDVNAMVAGETLSVDVTALYNGLIDDLAANPETAAEALGIRLQNQNQSSTNLDDGAVSFNNFRLQVVPEPSTACLLLIGLLAFVGRSRK